MSLLSDLANSLNEHNLQWCFLREHEYIWQNLQNINDVDVWCSSQSFLKVFAVVTEHGWVIRGGRALEVSNEHSIVIRFSHNKCNYILELWVAIVRVGPVLLFSENKILSAITENKGYPYLSLEKQFLMVTLRPLLLGRQLDQYVDRANRLLTQLSKSQKEKIEGYIKQYFSSREYARLIEYIENLGKSEPQPTLRRKKIWAQSLKLNSVFTYIAVKTKNLLAMMGKNSLIVTVVGVDGVGKSTILKLLSQSEHGYADSKILYLGRSKENSKFVSFVRAVIFQIFGIEKHKDNFSNNEKKKDEASFQLLKIAALMVYYIEYRIRYLALKILNYRKNRIIFGDRGALDLALMNGLGNIPLWIGNYVPRADLVVFCWATPNEILSRKQERSETEILRQQAILNQLTNKYCAHRKLRVCTNYSIDKNLRKIETAISIIKANSSGCLDTRIAEKLMRALDDGYDLEGNE